MLDVKRCKTGVDHSYEVVDKRRMQEIPTCHSDHWKELCIYSDGILVGVLVYYKIRD